MGESQTGKEVIAMKVREDNRGESTVTEDAWLGRVMHTCNPSPWKVRAGFLRV